MCPETRGNAVKEVCFMGSGGRGYSTAVFHCRAGVVVIRGEEIALKSVSA